MHDKHSGKRENAESSLLANWQMKFAILAAIAGPVIGATGAYYGIRQTMASDRLALTERVSKLELDTEKNFASKDSLERVEQSVGKIQIDVAEIKAMLREQRRR